jgi:hypothetical protein
MTENELIKNSKKPDCFAIVLRHSIREEIKDATQSQHQLLTDEGKKLAIDFGSKLPTNKKIRLFHSHVKRCEETAIYIKRGFKGEVSKIIVHNSLTGFYLLNPEPILRDVNIIGGLNFIRNWFSDFYPDNILMSALKARKQMTDHIIQNYDKNYLDIYITHDWNIVLLLSHLYKVIEKKYLWPNYMNGVSFENTQNEISIICDTNSQIKIF